MNIKVLIKDILTLNTEAFSYRLDKVKKILADRRLKKEVRSYIRTHDLYNIPVIINNKNRVTTLKAQIAWLEKVGMKRIYIIDNASTYPPLLDYYKTTPHHLFRLEKNQGHISLWRTGLLSHFKDEYFIYTDSDVIPAEECPADYIRFFMEILAKYPDVKKVGFGLKIDDLPDHYQLKQQVIDHEIQFWQHPVEDKVYRADIDTTFALYRPNSEHWVHSYRTGAPYVARHMPWYVDTQNLPAEEVYYKDHAVTDTHWTQQLNNLGK